MLQNSVLQNSALQNSALQNSALRGANEALIVRRLLCLNIETKKIIGEGTKLQQSLRFVKS